MNFFHPDSIAGRTMIVLLVGLTLSHIGSMALLSTDHHDAAIETGERLCAERMATAAALLEHSEPGGRLQLATNLTSPTMGVSWAPAPTVSETRHDPHADHLAQALSPGFGAIGHDRLHVVHTLVERSDGLLNDLLDGFPHDRIMAVSLRLSDGSWANFVMEMAQGAALKRALANLVENAARYGGQARVASRRSDRDIEVVIDDDGPGIPDSEREAVFTPFTRLETSRNRKTGGIGLGMTVARTIVRAHGGDIRLENRAEGGLRVIVSLPQESVA